jgi:hypothetical protein
MGFNDCTIINCTFVRYVWVYNKLNVDAAYQRRRQLMWTVTTNVQNQNWKSFYITAEYPKH